MEEVAVTVGDIFTQAGETVQGYMTLTGDFFSGLWSHPMGKIVATMGIAYTAYRLGKRFFHI